MFENTQPAALNDDGQSDAWSEFRVTHPTEIRNLLRQLQECNTPVNLSAPDGSAVSTTVWAVDTTQRRITFSAHKDNPHVQQMLECDEAVGVAYLEAVKLQFDLQHMMLVHSATSCALQAALPSVVYRFQRRSSYRVRTVERDLPQAILRHPSLPDMRLRLRVMDVSIGGCALFIGHDVPAIQPGLTLHDVRFELDAETHFSASVCLRHVSSIQPNARGVRMGCELVNLSPATQRALQLYIDQTQKRRRFLVLE